MAKDKVVWKYKLPLVGNPQMLALPVGSHIVYVELADSDDKDDPTSPVFYIWCEIRGGGRETDGEVAHVFQVFGTGDDAIPHYAKHVHTGIMWNEDHRDRRTSPQYVWHLYQYPIGTNIVNGKVNEHA